MRRLERPLDPKAVKAANEALKAETGGRPLTMEPEDAALRKKWVDAYLKAGGKEAKNFNSRPVKKSVQTCPLKNWIEVEYLYADERILNDKIIGVEGAICVVKSPDGAEIGRAKLDKNGFARIDGLPDDITDVTYYFDNDPPKYEIFQEYKPIENPLPKPDPNFIVVAGESGILGSITFWSWKDVKDGAEWVGGALAGDFNEDPSMGQIVLGTVITLIPIVDQVGDVRDIAAALKKLIWEKRYDDKWVWFDLVITIIGCIPEIGTVVKGIAKGIKKGVKGVELADLLRKLNWTGKGNAVQWLKKLVDDLPGYGKNAAEKIKTILNDLSSKLELAKKFASSKVASQIDELLETIKEVRKRVDKMVDEVISDLKKQLQEIIAKAKRLEPEGTTQTKNTLKQEKEALEVGLDATKGASKQARKVLALGLRNDKAGLNYSKWAKDNGWHTYGELSGRGPFSKQIREAMDNADDIHFNLDGVNVKSANGRLNEFGEPFSNNYTNYELWLLKTEPKFADKVIWYKNGSPMPKGYNPFSE
jgi:polyhydroxyalkanoate synthesis regulator phasin